MVAICSLHPPTPSSAWLRWCPQGTSGTVEIEFCGEPATPVLRAYVGDPVRIRFVHGAVKETHVFHQHVYQWHADPANKNSPTIDSLTVSPQTGHTIEFLYGAGSRQGAIGDAIFHCHLYPHFHEGMWGITRTFDRRQTGKNADGTPRTYPDGSPLENLEPLRDREAPPIPTATEPGFPFFIPGQVGQKSPVPPWPEELGPMPPGVDYRPPDLTTVQERNHLNADPRPVRCSTSILLTRTRVPKNARCTGKT